MTASVTFSTRNFAALTTSFLSTNAEISSGAYCLSFTLNRTAPSGRSLPVPQVLPDRSGRGRPGVDPGRVSPSGSGVGVFRVTR